jgi:hypothetical protein
VPSRLEKIQPNFASTSQSGVDWSNTVKNYLKAKSFPRAPNHPNVNVIWNGEVPKLLNGAFACSIHPDFFRKRQEASDICGSSEGPSPTPDTSSIQRLASESSASASAPSSLKYAMHPSTRRLGMGWLHGCRVGHHLPRPPEPLY